MFRSYRTFLCLWAALIGGCSTTPVAPQYPAPTVRSLMDPVIKEKVSEDAFPPPKKTTTEALPEEAIPHNLPTEPLPPGASSSPYGIDPIPSNGLSEMTSESLAIESDLPKDSPLYDAGAPTAYPDSPLKAPEIKKFFTLQAPPAVAALEADIEESFKGHNYKNAAAQLERAIRIQPKNAELWHVLAEVRLRERQPGLAEDLAKKSNAMAKNQVELIQSNWIIIAEARRQKGDVQGASEAVAKTW